MPDYFRLYADRQQFFDDNGDPLAGGSLATYEAGTTDNKATYQDNAGAAAHTNPIVLDSAGRVPAAVWGTTGDYKLVLKNSSGATIWTEDDVTGINDVSANAASEWTTFSGTPTRTGNTTFTLTGDQTTEFHVGRRLRMNDSSTLYGTIAGSSYSSPNTTVTVRLDSGALSASLSAVAYALVAAENVSVPYGLVPILSGSLSSAAALQFTDLSASYAAYLLVLSDLLPATDGVNLVCQVSTNNGSSYISTSSYRYSRVTGAGGAVANSASNADTGIAIAPSQGNTAGEEMRGDIWIRNPMYASDQTGIDWRVGYVNSSSNSQFAEGFGAYLTAGATNAIQFLYSSGNIATGEYALYGLRTL